MRLLNCPLCGADALNHGALSHPLYHCCRFACPAHNWNLDYKTWNKLAQSCREAKMFQWLVRKSRPDDTIAQQFVKEAIGQARAWWKRRNKPERPPINLIREGDTGPSVR